MARLVALFCFLFVASRLGAAVLPLTARELSLMLRSGYSSDAALRELETRKFADVFDPTLEKELLKAGANQSLIEALQSGRYQLTGKEVASFKAKQELEAVVRKENGASPAVNQSTPPPPLTETQIGGSMYDHLKDDLVYWHEGSLLPFDNEALERKRLYLLFFSAVWSKEGYRFTPQLVDYYNRIHAQHPELEVIFFSADRSQYAMENYVSQTNMPWPAVAYEKMQGKAGALAANLTHQIPRLILAETSGRILSDSGETKPDFDKVLADLDRILAANK